ncbi:MAG: TPM domain-containing protein [Oscillospiraceae bacterium]|nr:TPM domain-containing protein [Oscillospiraceae bacterium]
MRNFLSAIAAVFVCIIALTVNTSAYSSVFDDKAGLYTESQKKQLEEKQERVAELTGWNIAVVTTNIGLGTDGSRAVDYAEKYYDDTFGSDSSSVVYLIDIDYRFVSMDGDVLDYFNTKRLDTMLDACEKKYMNYDDVGNLEKFYYYLEYYYGQGTVPRDSNIGAHNFHTSGSASKGIIFSPIPGFIAAAVAVIVVVSRYKFHHAAPPNIYLNGNSINIYNRRDVFVREFTTRTRISDESSGGRSGGGGSRSHGGHSHGGGGRGGRR